MVARRDDVVSQVVEQGTHIAPADEVLGPSAVAPAAGNEASDHTILRCQPCVEPPFHTSANWALLGASRGWLLELWPGCSPASA